MTTEPSDDQAEALAGLDDLVEKLNRTIEVDPDDADAYHNRAISYKELGMDLESRLDAKRSKELGASNSGTRR